MSKVRSNSILIKNDFESMKQNASVIGFYWDFGNSKSRYNYSIEQVESFKNVKRQKHIKEQYAR